MLPPPPTAPAAHDPLTQTLLLLLQQQQRKHMMGWWAGFLLYGGLNVLAFYLGVSWLQMNMADMALALRELKLAIGSH